MRPRFPFCSVIVVCTFCIPTMTSAQRTQTQTPADAQPTQRFQAWDRNKDGKLSRDELPANLRRNFDRVDTNGDGAISPAEDAAIRGGNRRERNNRGARMDGVKVIANQPYAADDNPRHQLDLFLPEKRATDKPLPLLAFIHGGGWRGGDKRSGAGRVAKFVQSGKFAAASIGYRLSGEAQWPAQIHDCKAAIRWLKAHAKQYGYDADRMAVWGTSAGGHLVAMLGVTGDEKSLEGELGKHSRENSRVACVVDFYGPTNFLTMNDFESTIDHDAANSPESLLIGGAIQKRKDKARAACPLQYVSASAAPMLLMHGDQDRLVPFDQSIQLAAALREHKVPVYLVKIQNGGHGFPDAAVRPRVEQFLARHLLSDKDTTVSEETITLPQRQRK